MATAEQKAVVAKNGATSLAEIPEETLQARYGITRAEINSIKNALAPPGTTDYEMLIYLGVCRRLHLDPFVPGLVHFIRFEATQHRGARTGIVLGYLGYLQLAQMQEDCDGLEIQCFPEDPEKLPTHATVTVWKKTWSHPLKVTVSYKEKVRKSPFWLDSPRQALETAAVRRACRLAWPSLFAPIEEENEHEDDIEPPVVRGKVGTFMGEHHDAVDAEAQEVPVLPSPSAPAETGVRESASVPPAPQGDQLAPPAEKTTAVPAVGKPKVDELARQIVDLMDDPGITRDQKQRMWKLLSTRLDSKKLQSTWEAKPEDLPFLEGVRDELKRLHDGN